MQACFLRNLQTGEEIPLKEELVIGRSDSCGLAIRSSTLSRQHAALRPAGGGWQVRDCGSTNGTLLNGVRIGGEWTALQPGDMIQLGPEVKLELCTAGEAEEEATVSASYKAAPSSAAQPAPRPQPTYQPQPAPQPQPTYQPQPAPRPQPTYQPQPAPQSQPTYQPQPAPQPQQPPAQAGATRSAGGNAIRAKMDEAVKKGQIYIYILIGLVVVGLILGIAVHPAVGFLVLMPMIILFIQYSEKYASASKFMKNTPQQQIDRMLSGNWDSTPRYPKSEIYCGDYAIFCAKINELLPLENLAWIYITETKTKYMGVITTAVTKTANFCYRDGRMHGISIFEDDLKDLLGIRILPLNPNLRLGYTVENRQAYAQMTGKRL